MELLTVTVVQGVAMTAVVRLGGPWWGRLLEERAQGPGPPGKASGQRCSSARLWKSSRFRTNREDEVGIL